MPLHPTEALPAEIEALAALFDSPAPRYTSYPTAAQFTEDFTSADYREELQRAAGRKDEPLSLYVHVPFCARRCAYCACEVTVSRSSTAAGAYLARLEVEASLLARTLAGRSGVQVLHVGGGTPTFLTPSQLDRLFSDLGARFRLLAGAEVSVEIDPRVTTPEHIAVLRSAGVNRVSLGVQDLSPRVQEAIGRRQTAEETARSYQACRAAGFRGINLDLVYGLPGQDLESVAATIDQVIELRPDRIALYGYAHVPWMRPNQWAIDAASLPGPAARLGMLHLASTRLARAGYQPIGMDHFALPADPLAAASRERRLGRDFMGYNDHPGIEVLGLGPSAISHFGRAYAQNEKKLAGYYRMLDAAELPVFRGRRATLDDEVRRRVIHEVLCRLEVDLAGFEARTGLPFDVYFREESADLERLATRGLIERAADRIRVTAAGRWFLRSVALAFDRYNRLSSGPKARFSKAV